MRDPHQGPTRTYLPLPDRVYVSLLLEFWLCPRLSGFKEEKRYFLRYLRACPSAMVPTSCREPPPRSHQHGLASWYSLTTGLLLAPGDHVFVLSCTHWPDGRDTCCFPLWPPQHLLQRVFGRELWTWDPEDRR